MFILMHMWPKSHGTTKDTCQPGIHLFVCTVNDYLMKHRTRWNKRSSQVSCLGLLPSQSLACRWLL